MHPQPDEWHVCHAFRLRNLRLMMRKNVVLAATMDVDLRTQKCRRHGAALDMPTRAPAPPWAFPPHVAVFLIPGFPQCKIAGLFLLVFVAAHAIRGLEFVEIEVSERTVSWK